jgi:hypothetical protein
MFNLEQSISEWRKQMLAAGINTPVPLEELEAHLRDEIERQSRSGLSLQDAFEAAEKEIGPAGQLKSEFSKQTRLRDILEFELIGKEWYLKWGPAINLAGATAIFLFFVVMILCKNMGFAEMTSSDRISCLAAMTLAALFNYAGFFAYKWFPVIPDNRKRAGVAVTIAAPVLLGITTLLARANVSIEHLRVDFFWMLFVPFGALNGMVSGLERAARKKSAVKYRGFC